MIEDPSVTVLPAHLSEYALIKEFEVLPDDPGWKLIAIIHKHLVKNLQESHRENGIDQLRNVDKLIPCIVYLMTKEELAVADDLTAQLKRADEEFVVVNKARFEAEHKLEESKHKLAGYDSLKLALELAQGESYSAAKRSREMANTNELLMANINKLSAYLGVAKTREILGN